MPSAKKQEKDLDFEISFYEGMLKRDPNLVDVLICLGNDYTKRGQCEKGLEVDLRLSRLRPTDPVVFYNLACSYSLLGQTAPAIEGLEKALRLGYSDWEYLVRDPDLDNVRKDPRFEQLQRRHHRKRTKST